MPQSTEKVLKPDFQARCNICKMGKQNPELLEILIQMRFGEEKTFRQIVDEVNTVIERDGLEEKGIKPLFLSGLVTHMSDHISPEKKLAYELQEASSKKKIKTKADPDALNRAIDLKRQSLEKIEENLVLWQGIFEQCHKEFRELPAETVPGIRKLCVESMSKAHATWAELVKSKETLLKERTLMIEVMQQAVDLYARSVTGSIAEHLSSMREEFSPDDEAGQELMTQLLDSFKDAVKNSVTGLYEEAIRATADKYNL